MNVLVLLLLSLHAIASSHAVLQVIKITESHNTACGDQYIIVTDCGW